MAGYRARAKYANVEATDFYERAVESSRHHRVPRADLATVAEALGDVAELAARYEDADRAITKARQATDDPVASTRLLRKEGTLRVRQGRFTQGLRWYGRGLKAGADMEDNHERHLAEGQLYLAYAGGRFRQGKSRECVRWAHQAERRAETIDDKAMLAHAYYLLGIGYNVRRAPQASPYLHKSLALFEQEGDLLGSANVLNNLGVDAKDDGRWTEAIDLYKRSREARELTGDVVGAATASNNIAEILSDQGHLDEAEELFEEALRIWRRADFSIGIAIATSYLGRLHARRGRFDDARRHLNDALEQFREFGATHYVLETQVFQLECELLSARPDVVDQAELLVETATEMEDVLLLNILLRLKAWALEQVGEHDAAEQAVDAAITADEASRSPLELALALIVRGQIYRVTDRDRRPDHDRARAILKEVGVVSLPTVRSANGSARS